MKSIRAKASASHPSSFASTLISTGCMSSSTVWKHPLSIAARASRGLSLSQSFANDDKDEEVEVDDDENVEKEKVELPRKTGGICGEAGAECYSEGGGERREAKPDIRRLARRGGVKRILGNIYNAIRNVLKIKSILILQEAIFRAEYTKRNTITVTNILHSLTRQGRPMYGFDPETFISGRVWNTGSAYELRTGPSFKRG